MYQVGSKLRWVIDPSSDSTTESKCDQYIHMHGFLPTFLCGDDERPLQEQMIVNYGFPTIKMSGSVDDEGNYSYPQDPDLKPIGMFERNTPMVKEKVYIYQYGIVAFITTVQRAKDFHSTTTYITRMD